ncbi:TrmH family RNA methyltransferase [Polluticoccus soli]|uniref:TrmH family RNA methyltransferase n=1 Tax=Polluticoccus soli TaxID=3034150 RepID=UPI0023E1E3BC|nr:RNA methyltransferase [Flavipsychrobacter sp. JY13-12]
MLSKAQNKYIRSLSLQKYRKEHNVFIAEGDKISREWLSSDAPIQHIAATYEWAEANRALIDRHEEATLHIVDDIQLKSISTLQTPNHVLVVAHMPKHDDAMPANEWCIALDEIQDPGNMGTIIRIADWFGVKHIICSPGCVDVYNPKVVQSAMGGHLRVNIRTAPLNEFLSQANMPVYAAALNGQNIYEISKPAYGVLIIGNESKGISDAILDKAQHKVTIPRLGGAESLNAAVSAGIICALLMGR